MVIDILNKDKISFSNSFLCNEYEGRNSHTSYLNEFKIKDSEVKLNSDFLFRLICYNNLRKFLYGKYETNLDVFGGVGITAKLFSLGLSNTYVNDISEDCINILRNNFVYDNVFNIDVFNNRFKDKYDLILADFNDFTVKKFYETGYDVVLHNLMNVSNKYVIVNDCSVFYLRYGKKSYDVYSDILCKNINNYEEFFEAEKVFFEYYFPKWKLIRIEWFFSSSFLLFEMGDNVEFYVNKVESNKEKIISCEL